MKRITVKIGSSFFISDKGEIAADNIKKLIEQIKLLRESGFDVCLVTSGAIAVGTKKMKLKAKPHDTSKKQALAAIGQMTLMQIYEQYFDEQKLRCAQILVSHDDFGNRDRANVLSKTFDSIFKYGVVPVVNENDAVAVDEIKVGDNDTLSSMTSLLIDSSLLVLVSDVDGLFTANPNADKSAKLISVVERIDENIISLAKAPSSEFGTGGMQTKIKAAQISTAAGIPMVIMNANAIDKLTLVASGEAVGTRFLASSEPLPLKKCWLKYCANISGSVVVDEGAALAVLKRKSLLVCGVTSIEGQFGGGSVLSVYSAEHKLIAKGVTGLDSTALKQLIKEKTGSHVIIHANNLVVYGN